MSNTVTTWWRPGKNGRLKFNRGGYLIQILHGIADQDATKVQAALLKAAEFHCLESKLSPLDWASLESDAEYAAGKLLTRVGARQHGKIAKDINYFHFSVQRTLERELKRREVAGEQYD